MKVKQPVAQQQQVGLRQFSPVGPMFPLSIMPMSHFTYVQTSSLKPAFCAS
ncbi:MAG: hypothetical protein IPP95_00035 [Flavobacteriales bacterium]|nr:MAG: hypothetical protein IPP95_00035 [Flavobacteriales bacterium]